MSLDLLLYDAIMSNRPAKVAEYLESGADATKPVNLPTLDSQQHTETEGTGRAAKEVTKINDSARICMGTYNHDHGCRPLHVAVISFYHHHQQRQQSFEIIQHLLDHGANLGDKAGFFQLCNVEGFMWMGFRGGTALDLALTLKNEACSVLIKRRSALEELVTFLHEQSSGTKSLALPMTKVPVVARGTWNNLLLNDLCSDVTLVCGETELPAHTCVLASASDYFRQLFTGPWRTQVADGKLSTDVSAGVMRGVLSFMYVGEIDPTLMDSHAHELFSVSQQYFLSDLAKLAEARLVDTIGVDTLKDLLVLADLHAAETLKERCFAFVRQNKVSALTTPSMLSLAAEKPALWAEVVEMASANEPAAKRARTAERA